MNKQLPERSNLEQLKTQAKDLLHEVRAGQAGALVRIGNENRETFALHDAQRILAREYGFPSWPKLKLHIETRTDDDAESRLVEAVRRGETETLAELLRERPALARRSVSTAAVLADLPGLKTMLAGDPARIKAWGGLNAAEPLAYVCLGRLGGDGAARLECVEYLLANGADANGTWLDPEWAESRQPILYAAVGRNNYPAIARRLLAEGARTEDGESIYHAAEENHRECLEALAAAGADFSSRQSPYGNTPLYFLLGHVPRGARAATVIQGIRWLIQHGANPNVASYVGQQAETALHAVVNNGWPIELIEEFIAHGADANLPRKDGRTALVLAERLGRADVAALFRRHGAKAQLEPADQFLGACFRRDATEVQRLLAAESTLPREMERSEPDLLVTTAAKAPAGAIDLMLRAGFAIEGTGSAGETALLNACWHGRAETVRLLLAKGANPQHCDTKYQGSALGWCSHGSVNCAAVDGDYAAVAEALVAAGLSVPLKYRRSWEASEPVMAVLRKHGLI